MKDIIEKINANLNERKEITVKDIMKAEDFHDDVIGNMWLKQLAIHQNLDKDLKEHIKNLNKAISFISDLVKSA